MCSPLLPVLLVKAARSTCAPVSRCPCDAANSVVSPAAGRPSATPVAAITNTSRMTSHRMLPALAPNATRTPISRVRLDTVYDITNAVKKGVIAITIVALLFLAGGIALSPRRWRTLALAGWVTLGFFAFSIVAVAV